MGGLDYPPYCWFWCYIRYGLVGSLWHSFLLFFQNLDPSYSRYLEIRVEGYFQFYPKGVISFRCARCIVLKVCLSYLNYIHDTTADLLPPLDFEWAVREFRDVFPTKLIDVNLDHGNKFAIDVVLNTKLIFVIPYRMNPIDLMELKKKLQDLLVVVFVRMIMSLWGASCCGIIS